ncbi:type IV pilin-like G/H family protein [Microcoleus sp. FACHB-672]|uniref:type IV pilin-like G/H family protein n=1 Tax=Microcoleus sp. FACHB-672 TaxID=2692825 RepID=UPI001684E04F|nr:type IV pilin-like G/H family protein [Microcoleus sp. FACHB-672]MBD2042345.1 protein kinase [Microcoleus sp. FACHB-672]
MLQKDQVLQKRYQLKQQLGHNANRQTWLAEDLELKEPVIVKLLAFSPQMQWDEVKLFEREAKVLKQLHHPRIPQYLDYFSIDKNTGAGLPWFGLVQEYIPGKSLNQLLDEGKQFTESQVRSFATGVLEILIYLHELSPPVLHRDIKPSNLILGKNNQIYLVDFGAVQDKATAEGVTFTVVGTGGYAPMEQFWGRAVPASDLYALGATLIHLLTGTAPADLPQQNLRIQFNDVVNLNPTFSRWVETLTNPALEQRFSTARQALNALKTGRFSDELRATNSPRRPSNSVSYLRLGSLAVLQLLLVGIAYVIVPAFLSYKTSQPRPSEAKEKIGSMNRAQQAYYLENKTFSESVDKLGMSIKTQTENYEYSTRKTGNASFNYAIARKDNLKSYVGGVFQVKAVEQGVTKMTTQAILCEANSTGKAQSPPPIITTNGDRRCSSGTTEVKN